jgi:hypothetical protein
MGERLGGLDPDETDRTVATLPARWVKRLATWRLCRCLLAVAVSYSTS